jgi:uncharacterized membrane protein YozB (DUF420 family)
MELTGWLVILILKIAVGAVTLLLVASLIALARNRQALHGRINVVFFILTIGALVGLELIVRLIKPDIFDNYPDVYRHDEWMTILWIHLGFSIPSALLLPVMLWSGKTYRGTLHFYLGLLFLLFWSGTFITGIFFL